MPSLENRRQILKSYIEKIPNTLSDEDIKDIADSTNGFTGADIMALIRFEITSYMLHIFRESLLKNTSSSDETSAIESIILQKKNVEEAIEEIHPSGLKELILEIPKVTIYRLC